MGFFRFRFPRFLKPENIKSFAHSILGIVLIITVILCLYGVVFGEYGLVRILHLRNEEKKLCREIEILRMKAKSLENYKWRLETDEFVIEKLARERAGLCKPNEVLFVFQESDSTNIERVAQGLDK